MKIRSVFYMALLWFAAQAQAKFVVSLDLGGGYSRSSAPAMATTSDTLDLDQKTVGGDFSGFTLFLNVGSPIGRWFTIQTQVAGAYENGEVFHPATAWTSSTVPIILVPGSINDATRKTISYLAGVKVQDKENQGYVRPWAYALAGFATQSMKPDEENAFAKSYFYKDGKVSQSGFAMALGLCADVKVYRFFGARMGVEYQPIFLGDEKVVSEGEVRSSGGSSTTSRQDVMFVGEVMHHWRVTVGPVFGF